MGTIKTKGIILSESNTGDFDKMLTILTPGNRKNWMSSQRRTKTKKLTYGSAANFCALATICYLKAHGTYTMNSCETIEQFYNLRCDLDKLTVAANLTKIIMDVTTENENSYKIMQLFLNTIYTISETDKNISQVVSTFKLRLLSILGFTPKIKECTNCSDTMNIEYFSIKDNGFKCASCGRVDKSAIHIMPETVDAIRYSIMAPAKKIYSYTIPEMSIRELELVSKLYLNEKLEKEYK